MADLLSDDGAASTTDGRSSDAPAVHGLEASQALDARPLARAGEDALGVESIHRHVERERDDSVRARLRAAEQRDALADARDIAALVRDEAAAARDVEVERAGPVDEQAARTVAYPALRVARSGERAAPQRTQAGRDRVSAAEDRLLAQHDREEAARERLHALIDREMFVCELDLMQALRDKALGHQHRAEELARTLRRSLSPPRLPPIAGLDVAVHHEASAPEDVGGDFYDLFPLARARSGFFVGDVCGKGPQAAALTSLARYTMRTAAMLHESPDAILMDLNVALLMHADARCAPALRSTGRSM